MFSTPFTFLKSVSAAPPPVEQTFTTNGTWSCCSGATCVEVIAVGGGGGGRSFTGYAQPNPGRATGGPGGGAGQVLICTLNSGFGSSQCVIIGQGGASNNSGSASCFGALVIANGGNVGCAAVCVSGAGSSTVSAGAAVGGSPVGGNGRACADNFGFCTYLPQNFGCAGGSATGKPGGGGAGAGSSACMFGYFGCGGVGGSSSTICGITLGQGGTGGTNCSGPNQTIAVGGAAVGFGAGGGGAASTQSYDIGTTRAGGCGGPGVVKVIQYFS
jgi:hypothetical protein